MRRMEVDSPGSVGDGAYTYGEGAGVWAPEINGLHLVLGKKAMEDGPYIGLVIPDMTPFRDE